MYFSCGAFASVSGPAAAPGESDYIGYILRALRQNNCTITAAIIDANKWLIYTLPGPSSLLAPYDPAWVEWEANYGPQIKPPATLASVQVKVLQGLFISQKHWVYDQFLNAGEQDGGTIVNTTLVNIPATPVFQLNISANTGSEGRKLAATFYETEFAAATRDANPENAEVCGFRTLPGRAPTACVITSNIVYTPPLIVQVGNGIPVLPTDVLGFAPTPAPAPIEIPIEILAPTAPTLAPRAATPPVSVVA